MPGIMRDILNIIRYTMGRELNEDSLSYERLVTHLKFYLQRIVKREVYPDRDEQMQSVIRQSCPEEYACARRIGDFVKKKLGYETPEEELMYLTLHISRVVRG